MRGGEGLLATLLCFLLVITLTPADALTTPRSLGNDGLEGGRPGTIRGKVYDDHRHNPEFYNGSTRIYPQDWPIQGVLMKAMLVKYDGTVIMGRDEYGNPAPFEAVTDENGDYTFNFRPALREAYNLPPGVENKRVRIERFDRVRVWVDESNYAQPAGALKDFTPKRLNGGGRWNVVDTLTLSWLGTTNYIHGSISNFNMAYRPKTKVADNADDPIDNSEVNGHPASRQAPGDPVGNMYDQKGKHLPEDQWLPSSRHLAPEDNTLGNNLYMCGHVYADRTFRFDRWDNAPGNKDRTATKDPAVPGARVVVSTYAQDSLGKPTKILQTRYDYTDLDGSFCIGWDKVSEIHNRPTSAGVSPAKFMVTIESPEDRKHAKKQIQALIDRPARPEAEDGGAERAKSRGLYEELLKNDSRILTASETGSGLPGGFAAVGNNGWYGTIRPANGNAGVPLGVGVAAADTACESRTGYCLPDFLPRERTQTAGLDDYKLQGTGLNLGLIPTLPEVRYSRYSTESILANERDITKQESTDAKTVWADVKVPMPGFSYRLVAVPRGSSWDDIASNQGAWYFSSPDWVSSEDLQTFDKGLVKMQVPENFPTGDYQMALVSKREPQKDRRGKVVPGSKTEYDVVNLTPFRVTDSKVYTYAGNIIKGSDEEAENNAALDARNEAYGKSQEGKTSRTALPGQTVYASYLDLGESRDATEGAHRVELCTADSEGKLKLTGGKPTCRDVDSQIRPDTQKNASGGYEPIKDQFKHNAKGEWRVPVDMPAGHYIMRLVHTKSKSDFDVAKPIAADDNYPLPGLTLPRDEIVDQRPFTIAEPFIDGVSKPCGEDGKSAGDATVTLKGLRKGAEYKLSFKPNGGGSEISKTVTPSCADSGICTQQVTFTSAELAAIRVDEAKTGRGILTLSGNNKTLDTDSMIVLSQNQCETSGNKAAGWEWDQPEIVLPNTEIHLGYTPEENAAYVTEVIEDKDRYTQFNRIKYGAFSKGRYNKGNGDPDTNIRVSAADFRTNCVENPTVGELDGLGNASRQQDKDNSAFCHIPCAKGEGEGSCQQLYGAPYGTPVYLTPYRRNLNSGVIDSEKNGIEKELFRNGPIRVEVRDGKDYRPGSVLSDAASGGRQRAGQLVVWNNDAKLKNSVQTSGQFDSAGASAHIDYGAWQFFNKRTGAPVDGFRDIVWRVKANGRYYGTGSRDTGEKWPTLVWGDKPGGGVGKNESLAWWSNRKSDGKRWESEVKDLNPGYFLVRPGGEKMPNQEVVLCSPKVTRQQDGSISQSVIANNLNKPDGCVQPADKAELNVGLQVLTFDYQTQKTGDYLSREWMDSTKVLDKDGNELKDASGNPVIHKGKNVDRPLPKAQTKQAVLVPYNARRFYNENWSNPRPHQFHWGESVGLDGRWVATKYNETQSTFIEDSTGLTAGGNWASQQWNNDLNWDNGSKKFKMDKMLQEVDGSFCKYIFRYHNGTSLAGTTSSGYDYSTASGELMKFIPRYEQEALWRKLGLDIVTVTYRRDKGLPPERVGCVVSTDTADGVPVYAKGSFMDKYRTSSSGDPRYGDTVKKYDKKLEPSLPDKWDGKNAVFQPRGPNNKPTGRLRYGAPLGIHDLQVDVINEPEYGNSTPNSRITLPEPWRIEVLPNVELKNPVISAWTGAGDFSPKMVDKEVDGQTVKVPADGTTVWNQNDTYKVHRGDNFDLKFLAGPNGNDYSYQIEKFEPTGDNRPKGVNLAATTKGVCLNGTSDGLLSADQSKNPCDKRIIKLDGTVASDAELGIYKYKVTATSTNSSDHGANQQISFIMNIEVLGKPAAPPSIKPDHFYGTVDNPAEDWGPIEFNTGKNSDGSAQRLIDLNVTSGSTPEGIQPNLQSKCVTPGDPNSPDPAKRGCQAYGYYFFGTPTKAEETTATVTITVENSDGNRSTATANYIMTVTDNQTEVAALNVQAEAGTLITDEKNYVGKSINAKTGHKRYKIFAGLLPDVKNKVSGLRLDYATVPGEDEAKNWPVLSLDRENSQDATTAYLSGKLNKPGTYDFVARWSYQGIDNGKTVRKVATRPIKVVVEDATPPLIGVIPDQQIYLGENGKVASDTNIDGLTVTDNGGDGSYPVAIAGKPTALNLNTGSFCAPIVKSGNNTRKVRHASEGAIQEYLEDTTAAKLLGITAVQGHPGATPGSFETDNSNDSPWRLTLATQGIASGKYMCHVNFADATNNLDRNTTRFSPDKSLNEATGEQENWLGERTFLLNVRSALELDVVPDETTIVKGAPMFRPMNVEAYSHESPAKINVQTLCAPPQKTAGDEFIDGLPTDRNGDPSVKIMNTKLGAQSPAADQIALEGYKARTTANIDGNANDAKVGKYKCYVYAVAEGYRLNSDGTVQANTTGKPIEGVNWARKSITIDVVQGELPRTGVFSLNYFAGYAALLIVTLTGFSYLRQNRRGRVSA
ncbi:hypothetical protein [Varibaculum vaginae]|uniref:hypothetical protein n=1 Tax=Varibaculum vaginae TaxID=2364797 RepID=UPI0011C4A641|nr:hypothetical protein [Varibaculum vaginae]